MFHPKALHLALAASATLAISAGARSEGSRPVDTDATITTSNETRAADLTTSDRVRSDRATRTTSNAPALPCQGDITGDRRVDVFDLMQVLMDWGTCASEPDLGSVGRTDSTGLSDLSGNGRRRPTANDRSTGLSDLSGKASAGPSLDNGGRRRGPTADDGSILGQVLPCLGDLNGDGFVDGRDMAVVLTNMGKSCP